MDFDRQRDPMPKPKAGRGVRNFAALYIFFYTFKFRGNLTQTHTTT